MSDPNIHAVVITQATGPSTGSEIFPAEPVNASNPLYVQIAGSALPTGAATAAKQDTGNGSLAAIATSVAAGATSALQTSGNTILSNILTRLGSVVLGTGSAVIGKVGIDPTNNAVAPRAPQNLTMTVVTVPPNTSVLAIAANPTSRKSLQILNIGLGFATAKPFAAAGTGGTIPTTPGQTSATSNTVTLGVGYPLEAASAAGHQGGSTPIYDGVALSIDEWDVVAGSTATTVLVIEGN